MAREQRRLAAVLAADVVGYSRLMGRRDEAGTLARLSPRDPQRFALLNMHAIALFAAGRYAEAISPAHTACQERSGYAQALRMLTAARALHGDMAGARTALRDLQLAEPGITPTWVDKNVDAPDAVRPHLLEGLRLAGMPE